ncbi:hypothetical protein ACFQZ4_42420 [Catellatospora coxensis]
MTSVLLVGWRPKAIAALRRLGAEVTCALRPGDDDHATTGQRPHRAVRVADPAGAESVLAAWPARACGPATSTWYAASRSSRW